MTTEKRKKITKTNIDGHIKTDSDWLTYRFYATHHLDGTGGKQLGGLRSDFGLISVLSNCYRATGCMSRRPQYTKTDDKQV